MEHGTFGSEKTTQVLSWHQTLRHSFSHHTSPHSVIVDIVAVVVLELALAYCSVIVIIRAFHMRCRHFFISCAS
jgi:hypothetical protein